MRRFTWNSPNKPLIYALLAFGCIFAGAHIFWMWLVSGDPDNPYRNLPPEKPAQTRVAAGEDCGSYTPGVEKDDAVNVHYRKIVVYRGVTTCGEAADAITHAYSHSTRAGRISATTGPWKCTVLDAANTELAGYTIKCVSSAAEVRLISALAPNPGQA